MISLHRTVLAAVFAGTAAVVGYLLMSLPNIEAFSAVLFVSGYSLGISYGTASALGASLIYFGLNPQGGFFPPLLAGQIVGAWLFVLGGAFYKRLRGWDFVNKNQGWILAVFGLTFTLTYDIVTNLAYPLTVGFKVKAMLVYLISAIPFSILHVISNVFIFIFLVPALLDTVIRLDVFNEAHR